MHPTIGYDLHRARAAELRDQAQRDRLAARARRRQLTDHLPTTPVMAARRLLTVTSTHRH